MNLTEIEKAVTELSSRHTGLTKEFLRTLLEASGWEEKHIKEAQIIFDAHLRARTDWSLPSELPKSKQVEQGDYYLQKEEPITFLRSDGGEEGSLQVEESSLVRETSEVDQGQAENKKLEKIQEEVYQKEKEPEVFLKEMIDDNKEENSLVLETATRVKVAPQSLPPDNLPLVPFESSPHVWSFGRYRDTFHPEERQENQRPLRVQTETATPASLGFSSALPHQEVKSVSGSSVAQSVYQAPVIDAMPQVAQQSSLTQKENAPQVEVDLEKTPITKADESLVVLAAVMLLAILLILGYMYSNGRL